MELEKYLQIAILAILAVLLWRDNRIEKRREAQKDRDLAFSFHHLKERLEEDIHAAVCSIKAEVDLTYNSLSSSLLTIAETQYSEILKEIRAIGNILVDQASVINILSSLPAHIDDQIAGFNSQLSTINAQLTSLQTPIRLWGEAQANNIIKEGEANRTLRKRLQEKNEYITQLNCQLDALCSQLKSAQDDISAVKTAASSYLAQLVSEVDYITTWIGAKGMPLAALTKALNIEFKGQIPSREYHKAKDQKNLQDTLAVDAASSSMPLDPSPPEPLDHSQEAINA